MTQQPNEQAQWEEIRLETDVLVFGGGLAGAKAAREIAGRGYRVLLAEKAKTEAAGPGLPGIAEEPDRLNTLMQEIAADPSIEVMPGADLVGAAGIAGDFTVWLSGSDAITERRVGAIVVSGELHRRSLEAHYGLTIQDNIVTQSILEEKRRNAQDEFKGKTVALLAGFGQEGDPLATKRLLVSAAALQDIEGCTAYIYVNDLKVAHNGLERLYLGCRDKGAITIKLRERPGITAEEGRLNVTYTDPVLRREMTLQPDIIVVEEQLGADPGNDALADLLKIDMGGAGFLQKENIHRFPVETNRAGVFVIGKSRGVQMPGDTWVDAENVALQIQALLGTGIQQIPVDKAVLDTGKCTFCLTCFRCCPHGAIYWEGDNKPVISKTACQGCGICASECPMDAIQIGEFTDQAFTVAIRSQAKREAQSPRIIAFCCQNSALEAGMMAEAFKMALPRGLKTVKVPCAGKIDIDYILTAFAEGADGVLVMACHTGNCKSERGNTFASWRVAEARRKLEAAGLEKERLRFVTLASNMGTEFSATVMNMEEKIKEIGLNLLGQ